MTAPEVSLVIPAWGAYAGAPLQEALASIRDQETPAKLIVVDNASDEPLGPLEGVELVRTERRLHVGGARNIGLERVTTPYMLFWDADDLMLPGTLAFLLREIEADDALVAVAAGVVDESGARHRWPPRWSAGLARYRRTFAFLHSVWSLFPSTGATIIRTDPLREGGGYADAAPSGEDWAVGVSLAHRGRVALYERPGRVYRRLGPSLWHEHQDSDRRLAQAAAVRGRLRHDRTLSRWARHSALLLRLLHPAVILVIAPMARQGRELFDARR